MPGRGRRYSIEKSQENVWKTPRLEIVNQEAISEKQENDDRDKDNGNLLTSLKDVFATLCEETSCHGIKYVGGSKYCIARRILWLCLVIGASVVVFIILNNAVQTFLRKPVQTKLSVQFRRHMQFPTVTICNLNRLRKTHILQYPNITEVLRTIFPITIEDYNFSPNWSDPIFAPYVNQGEQTLPQIAIEAAHKLENMFMYCIWNGRLINCSEEFKMVITNFGVCYQFNSNGTLNASRIGAAYGLWLRVNIEQYEYSNGDSDSAGLKVLLHRHNEAPQVKELGFVVGPGLETLVSLHVTQIKSLPPPYEKSDCLDIRSQHFVNHLTIYDTYSVTGCRQECLTNVTLLHCGCKDIFAAGPGNPCPANKYTCVREAHGMYAMDDTIEAACKCKVPCSNTLFEYQTSSALWPSNHVVNEYIMAAASNNAPMTKENIRENGLDLRIFYKKMNFDLVEEVPGYELMDLLANIGGNLGLCLGASILTIFELFEFNMIFLFRVFSHLKRKRMQ